MEGQSVTFTKGPLQIILKLILKLILKEYCGIFFLTEMSCVVICLGLMDGLEGAGKSPLVFLGTWAQTWYENIAKTLDFFMGFWTEQMKQ